MSIHLAPDIEAGLLAEAAARGVSVDVLIRKALQAYRRQPHSDPPEVRVVPYKDRRAEMDWVSHPDLQYVGQWVVLEGSKVVASDPDGKALYQAVRDRGIESPFMFYVAPPNPTPFVGGWIE
jgi:hypothetical protein